MKKLMILVSAVALSTTMFAQKAGSDNPYSLEGNVNFSKDGMAWNSPDLRLRYFFKDNMAARITLGRSTGSTKFTEDVSTTVYDSLGNATVTTSTVDRETSSSSTNVNLGIEYHLPGTDRMSPYFSGQIGFGRGSNTDANDNETSSNSMGFGIGAGLDYYLVENLYVGVEFGLNYNSSTDENDVKTVSTGFGGNSNVRFGWRF